MSKLILITRDDFLNNIQSINTKEMAKKALKQWDAFLKYRKVKEAGFMDSLKEIQKDPEFYQYLNLFVQYMNNQNLHPHSVRSYFSSIKSYLRSQGFRIYNEDVKQFIKQPKILKEQKEGLSKETIQKMLTAASPKLQMIILGLVTSGMRSSELLQLKKSDLKEPKIILRPEITKTGAGRSTYFTSQMWRLIDPILSQKSNDDYVFCYNYRPLKSLQELENKFGMLRDRLNISTRYSTSRVHTITLHRLRAFCKTQASETCGKDYAEGLIGHEGYLSTYYNLTEEAKYKNYINKLEPILTFEL